MLSSMPPFNKAHVANTATDVAVQSMPPTDVAVQSMPPTDVAV